MKNLWYGIGVVGVMFQSPLLLLIRLYWGYQFAVTGFGKLANPDMIAIYFATLGIPSPYFSAVLTGSVEFIGGILLIFGLFSRMITIPLLIVLMVATFTAHYEAVDALFRHFDPQPFFAITPFLFIYALLVIFCFGPGKISLDYWLVDSKKKAV